MESGPSKKLGASSQGIASRGKEQTRLACWRKLKYFRRKLIITPALSTGPGRRWSGWDRWSSTWTFPPGRQDTGRDSRHGTVDSHWPRQRSSRRTGRHRWTRPRCSPGWSWSRPPGLVRQIWGPGLDRRLVSRILLSDIEPHRLGDSHLLSGCLSEGEESH